jgi:hypothetical protein
MKDKETQTPFEGRRGEALQAVSFGLLLNYPNTNSASLLLP